MSLIRTPIIEFVRLSTKFSLFCAERAALMPATSPWEAAS